MRIDFRGCFKGFNVNVRREIGRQEITRRKELDTRGNISYLMLEDNQELEEMRYEKQFRISN